jgi:RES domain-containing protein
VKRRVARIAIREVPVLDLTDPRVRTRLGVRLEELVADNFDRCQFLADLAQSCGSRIGGMLVPSAVDPRISNLVLFPDNIAYHASITSEYIERPPGALHAFLRRVLRRRS